MAGNVEIQLLRTTHSIEDSSFLHKDSSLLESQPLYSIKDNKLYMGQGQGTSIKNLKPLVGEVLESSNKKARVEVDDSSILVSYNKDSSEVSFYMCRDGAFLQIQDINGNIKGRISLDSSDIEFDTAKVKIVGRLSVKSEDSSYFIVPDSSYSINTQNNNYYPVRFKDTANGNTPGIIKTQNGSGLNIAQGNISLKEATDSSLGGISLGYSNSGSKRAVELDNNNKAFVDLDLSRELGSPIIIDSSSNIGLNIDNSTLEVGDDSSLQVKNSPLWDGWSIKVVNSLPSNPLTPKTLYFVSE